MRVAVGCILALFAVEASGAATWIRVSSPSIQLFTDCGEKTARTILQRFETLHQVFGESHIAASPAPLLVFVFASAEEYEKYRGDTFSVGMFRSTGDEDLIALYLAEDALQRVVSHEYLHAGGGACLGASALLDGGGSAGVLFHALSEWEQDPYRRAHRFPSASARRGKRLAERGTTWRWTTAATTRSSTRKAGHWCTC